MDGPVSDDQLIARIAGADAIALEALYVRYQARIFRFIARIVRDEAAAEDLTNEVFVDVWRHARGYEARSSVNTWLLSIAHNRAISALRKRREEPSDDERTAALRDDADDPETAAQKNDKSRLLRRCIDALPVEYREIVDLVYYHELSVAEASAVVGIPEGTVKTRMFNARKRLSELLKDAGVDRGWP
ncbi:sigma-70 family RNA polymerase sigma factor [Bradyrhizobium sp.]|uniref:sigma-70 family RNA polymerase sigma factor n=1 Tax=Bradyrhizobium sp. TaxID=376 RepID=UPI003C70E995